MKSGKVNDHLPKNLCAPFDAQQTVFTFLSHTPLQPC